MNKRIAEFRARVYIPNYARKALKRHYAYAGMIRYGPLAGVILRPNAGGWGVHARSPSGGRPTKSIEYAYTRCMRAYRRPIHKGPPTVRLVKPRSPSDPRPEYEPARYTEDLRLILPEAEEEDDYTFPAWLDDLQVSLTHDHCYLPSQGTNISFRSSFLLMTTSTSLSPTRLSLSLPWVWATLRPSPPVVVRSFGPR